MACSPRGRGTTLLSRPSFPRWVPRTLLLRPPAVDADATLLPETVAETRATAEERLRNLSK
jgi:hypothetical protein